MQSLFRTVSYLAIAVICISLSAGCGKKTFKDGVGLYSVKQYHSYIISSGDTGKLADVKISTSQLTNNYLSWNSITFHVNFNSDTLKTYLKDSAIDGVTQTLYTLRYIPQTDKVVVYDLVNQKLWQSF